MANYKIKYEVIELVNFDYVDDCDNLHRNADISSIVNGLKFGCGIYTFVKVVKSE